MFALIEHLATTLSPADADILRVWIDVNRTTINDTQTELHAAQEQTRGAVRREPFDIDALHTAMAKARTARRNFNQVITDIFATSAAQMSTAGRLALAEWPVAHKYASTKQGAH